MKKVFLVLLVLYSISIQSQTDEIKAIHGVIESFFEGFHAQDTMKMRSLTLDGIRLQSIGADEEGETRLRTDDFDRFLEGLVTIPKERNFQEKLNSFNIQVDGAMANVWTAYEFWIDGRLSHCGVNSFHLINEGEGWKIIYLIDTRRRTGCE